MKAVHRLSSQRWRLEESSVLLSSLGGQQVRWQSNVASVRVVNPVKSSKELERLASPKGFDTSSMSRLTTWHLMRNVILSSVLTRPLLMKPALAMVQKIANSTSPILHPDRNPLLRAVLKPLFYDHFCAGTNKSEIDKTIAQVRRLGFAGVILCYGREIQLGQDNKAIGAQDSRQAEFVAWRDGTLETLDMVDAGNWIGIKFTGAGQDVTEALCRAEQWSKQFEEAIVAICEKAKARNCRIWIDAEQQAVQKGIDRWTIDLMRRFNTNGEVLVYNTIQAYLKESRTKLQKQLEISSKEGWTLAVKLVRGAYIANDKRSLIHDTKSDTDKSYNGIVQDLMQGRFDGFSKEKFPGMRLFLAGHNPDTVKGALELGERLSATGQLRVNPEFGQLQGMADDVGCDIVAFRESLDARTSHHAPLSPNSFSPQVYKCLTWGSIQECIQYLVRRAIENSAAVDRMRATATASRKELGRRMFPQFRRKA